VVAVLCFVGDISFSNRYLDRLERLRWWQAERVPKRDCRWSPSHTEGDRQSPGPQGLKPPKPMGFSARLNSLRKKDDISFAHSGKLARPRLALCPAVCFLALASFCRAPFRPTDSFTSLLEPILPGVSGCSWRPRSEISNRLVVFRETSSGAARPQFSAIRILLPRVCGAAD
jgi:hypothetical protein